jgi:hypothetical protein
MSVASCWNGLALPTAEVPVPDAVAADPAVPEGGGGSALQFPPTPGCGFKGGLVQMLDAMLSMDTIPGSCA